MNNFLTALKDRQEKGLIPVIPDIKCYSPKEGDLLRGRDPVRLAKELEQAGACALSVVTEKNSFRGSVGLLRRICSAVKIPVLRKDFLENAEDLAQTKEAGASAVLLMYSCLGKEKLETLYREALALGLLPFVETHTGEELAFAARLHAPLTGINNRDILILEKDDGDVSHAADLLPSASKDTMIVVESGLLNGADVRRAVRAGADAVLVGTAILQDNDPAAMYRSMTRPCNLKICGLMDRQGVDLCLKYHADALGFVTEYPVNVPWNLKREQTAGLIQYAKRHPANPAHPVRTCIVTGGKPEKVIALAKELKPDALQLHYTETLKETARIAQELHKNGIRLIRSIPSDEALQRKMFGTDDLLSIIEMLENTETDALLLDSRDAGNAASGGGSILDREKILAVRGRLFHGTKTFMAGGGIKAGNVREAIRSLSPDAVDIMTGVETAPGQKSEALLKAVISAMEQAEHA